MSFLIFLSYSRKDQELVIPIAKMLRITLTGNSLHQDIVFLDLDSIRVGENWREKINDAILNASKVYLFWCIHSSNSEEVKNEYEYALKNGKIVIPILFDNTPLPDTLQDINFLDFTSLSKHPLRVPDNTMSIKAIDPISVVSNELEKVEGIDSKTSLTNLNKIRVQSSYGVGREDQNSNITYNLHKNRETAINDLFIIYGDEDDNVSEFKIFIQNFILPQILGNEVLDYEINIPYTNFDGNRFLYTLCKVLDIPSNYSPSSYEPELINKISDYLNYRINESFVFSVYFDVDEYSIPDYLNKLFSLWNKLLSNTQNKNICILFFITFPIVETRKEKKEVAKQKELIQNISFNKYEKFDGYIISELGEINFSSVKSWLFKYEEFFGDIEKLESYLYKAIFNYGKSAKAEKFTHAIKNLDKNYYQT